MISISLPLNLVMIDIASSKTALHLGQLLVETIDCYKSEGVIINCVKCDNESCLSAARQTINSRGATLSIAGIKSNGIAQIDRAIRLIKERVRCILHASPFHVPRSILPYCVQFAVRAINLIGRGGEGNISPRELFTGQRVDYNVDVRVSFGEYVQTLPSETDNSMSERSNGCIALLPCGNATGTVMFYHLATKRVISRDKWVALPMPDSVINFLNDLAAAESGKSKLPLRDPSFTYRGKLILDSSQPEHADTAILRSIHEERSALRHANTRSVIFDENQLANHLPPPLGAGRVVSIDDGSSDEASSSSRFS
jgi:hypothetical protein